MMMTRRSIYLATKRSAQMSGVAAGIGVGTLSQDLRDSKRGAMGSQAVLQT